MAIATSATLLRQHISRYSFVSFKAAGEVLAADDYTSKPEKMFERLKAANPPNWTYLST